MVPGSWEGRIAMRGRVFVLVVLVVVVGASVAFTSTAHADRCRPRAGPVRVGDAGFFGSTGGAGLNQPIVGMAPHAQRRGLLAGRVPTAASSASATPSSSARPARRTSTSPIVGMAAAPTGHGLLARRLRRRRLRVRRRARSSARPATIAPQRADRRHGRHAAPATATGSSPPTAASSRFGDATFYGSTGAIRLNQPDRRHGRRPRRQRLLARRLRRRRLRVRRRDVPRLDRRHRARTSRSSAWPPTPTDRLLARGARRRDVRVRRRALLRIAGRHFARPATGCRHGANAVRARLLDGGVGVHHIAAAAVDPYAFAAFVAPTANRAAATADDDATDRGTRSRALVFPTSITTGMPTSSCRWTSRPSAPRPTPAASRSCTGRRSERA